jgi:hypothetical protein
VTESLPSLGGERAEAARYGDTAPEPAPLDGPALDVTPGRPGDPWAATPEVLSAGAAPPSSPRRRGMVTLAAAAAVVALVGSSVLAWAAFNGDTADQPEKHLPATAGALVKVDLDPPAGQKVDAVRFFAKFPFGGGLRGSGGDDPRRFLYEQLSKDAPAAPAWSEVEPWIGQRAAIGVVPGTDAQPTMVALLQVTDEAKATATLAKAAGTGTAFTVADGWATISDTRAHVDAVTAGAASAPLADDAAFRRDVDALGDAGVLAAWADPARFPALVQSLSQLGARSLGSPLLGGSLLGGSLLGGSGGPDLLRQRLAVVARFTGGDAELVARSFGTTPTSPTTGAGAAVGKLPEGTVAAVGVAGLGGTVRKTWSALGSRADAPAGLGRLEAESGLRLPDDLVAILGGRVTLALAQPDGSGRPVAGLRGQSDDPGLAGALDRLLAYTDTVGLPLERRKIAGGYVLATTRQEAEALSQDGGLGGTDAFRAAVPDADRAQAVAFLDVERLTASYGQEVDGDVAAYLKPLRAVGLAVVPSADGTTTTLRVTTR